jgi:hypothetical protein
MTTAEAVKHLREISCETVEMRAKIADLLEAKDAECKAWRRWDRQLRQDLSGEVAFRPPFMPGPMCDLTLARRRCDELEGKE